MTGHDGSKVVRVCLTRCPLPPAEERVHSLPCRIHHDGAAAVATFFHPKNPRDERNDGTDEDCLEVEMREDNQVDEEDETNGSVIGGSSTMTAEFRGVQLQGQKLVLAPLGLTGLVLDDSGMRHEDDEGRIWEVEDHFDELTWWDVPQNTTRETHQLPLALHQWHDLSAAIHGA